MLAGLGASAALAVALREGDALRARYSARRDVQADMERFREQAAKVTDVEALLKDRRALQVVLEAFQLESEIGKTAILRKLLTEPLSDENSLANRFADQRYKEFAAAFAASRTVALSTSQVAALSTTEARGFAINEMAGLTAAQVAAFGSAQLAALDPAQIRAIGSSAIAAMDTGDLAALGTAQVAALRPSQLGALTGQQAAAIETTDLAALGTAQIRGFGSTQLAALTTTQLQALRSDQLAALTTTQIAAFDATQMAAFTPRQSAALGTSPLAAMINNRLSVPEETATPLMQDRALLDDLVDRTLLNRYEKAMGESNGGLREALYFIRSASKITSINSLMSDKAMTTVMRGALGLPEAFASLEFEQQRDILTRRVDLADFQDPKAVEKIARRYIALAAPTSTTTDPMVALFDTTASAGSLASLATAQLSILT